MRARARPMVRMSRQANRPLLAGEDVLDTGADIGLGARCALLHRLDLRLLAVDAIPEAVRREMRLVLGCAIGGIRPDPPSDVGLVERSGSCAQWWRAGSVAIQVPISP